MDESEMAERAFQYALEVHPDAEITVVHVVGEPSSMMGGAAGIAMPTTRRRRRGTQRAICSTESPNSPRNTA